MFNPEKFLLDYGISHAVSGKNTSPKFINIQCPFCADSSTHGGFHRTDGYYNCWLCGHHSLSETIRELLGIDLYQAIRILKKYQERPYTKGLRGISEESKEIISKVSFPMGTSKLKKIHKEYLKKRNFNPNQLEKEWRILGTEYLGNYKFRIVIPIYFNGNLVSYQARDITGESGLRYKACSKNNEILHHKHLLYGLDKIKSDKIIVCEGIFDCWRLGKGAVATFGIEYTTKQLLLLAAGFSKIFILFDSEFQAQKQADKLASELVGLGRDVEILDIEKGDPADLSDKEAREIMELVE